MENTTKNTTVNSKPFKDCGKVSFSDEAAAQFYIDKLQKTSKRPRVPQRTYLCHKCLNWHLTSQGEKQTYETVINDNENLKKQIIEKDRIISELRSYRVVQLSIDKDKLLDEKNKKINELTTKVSKLESILKKKDKCLNEAAKHILRSIELK